MRTVVALALLSEAMRRRGRDREKLHGGGCSGIGDFQHAQRTPDVGLVGRAGRAAGAVKLALAAR